jgi:hypothetical protein
MSRDANTFSSPAWHAQALDDSEIAVAEHKAGFVPWDEAKKALLDTELDT